MGEIFIGEVAGERIGRLALANDAFNSGYGYGLYFTDNRVIGLSYQKIVSRAYRTAYLLSLIWGVFLVSAAVYGKLTGVPSEQPSLVGVLAGPIAAGWAVFLLVFLLYVTPRQAGNRIRREAPTSMLGLANQSPDFVLGRANISQVTIQGGRINILSKSGQWYSFIGRMPPRRYSMPFNWRGQPRQLFDLIQRFCSLNPPITVFVKERRQWNIISQTEIPS